MRVVCLLATRGGFPERLYLAHRGSVVDQACGANGALCTLADQRIKGSRARRRAHASWQSEAGRLDALA